MGVNLDLVAIARECCLLLNLGPRRQPLVLGHDDMQTDFDPIGHTT